MFSLPPLVTHAQKQTLILQGTSTPFIHKSLTRHQSLSFFMDIVSLLQCFTKQEQ